MYRKALLAACCTGTFGCSTGWAQIAHERFELSATAALPSDYLGWSVAISDFGVLATAPDRDGADGELTLSGAVYLFDRETGKELQVFYAPDPAIHDHFGDAIAAFRNLALISATGEDEVAIDTGCAYLLDLETGTFIRKILPEIGGYQKRFGEALAINEQYIVIGAPGDDGEEFGCGSVYIFDTSSGALLRKITPPSPQPDGQFGRRLALDGSNLLVADLPGSSLSIRSGNAYLFNAASGELLQQFDSGLDDPRDFFGSDVDIKNGIVAVGSHRHQIGTSRTGAVFLYEAQTGELLSIVTAANPVNGASFGESVVLGEQILAVGSPDLFRNSTDAGSVLLFDISDPQQAIYKRLYTTRAPNGSDYLGRSIAMSGTTLVAGAYAHEAPYYRSGAAFVFDLDSYQLNSDIAPAGDATSARFGATIAADQSTLLIGSPGDSHSVESAGSASIYSAVTGDLTATLIAPFPASGDEFGCSISISEDLLLVGAKGDDTVGSNTGAAHIYDRHSLEHLGTLLPDSGFTGSAFGASVAQSEDFIAVGAPDETNTGAAYLFDAVTKQRIHKFVPANHWNFDMNFGSAIDVSEQYVVVGADRGNGASQSGTAYIFDAVSGEQLHQLFVSGSSPNNAFGASVQIIGERVLIGSANRGRAFLFDLATGDQLVTYEFLDSEFRMLNASSIAVQNGVVYISAETSTGYSVGSGAVYLFDLESGLFLDMFSLRSSTPEDRFGSGIAHVGGSLWVGASLSDVSAVDSGRVYRFSKASTLFCMADVNESAAVDLDDLNIVLTNFGQQTSNGDANGDGFVDLNDLNAVLTAFGTDCP